MVLRNRCPRTPCRRRRPVHRAQAGRTGRGTGDSSGGTGPGDGHRPRPDRVASHDHHPPGRPSPCPCDGTQRTRAKVCPPHANTSRPRSGFRCGHTPCTGWPCPVGTPTMRGTSTNSCLAGGMGRVAPWHRAGARPERDCPSSARTVIGEDRLRLKQELCGHPGPRVLWTTDVLPCMGMALPATSRRWPADRRGFSGARGFSGRSRGSPMFFRGPRCCLRW